jgi:hypothetical protein
MPWQIGLAPTPEHHRKMNVLLVAVQEPEPSILECFDNISY